MACEFCFLPLQKIISIKYEIRILIILKNIPSLELVCIKLGLIVPIVHFTLLLNESDIDNGCQIQIPNISFFKNKVYFTELRIFYCKVNNHGTSNKTMQNII